jgi:hypothetical protein
VAGWSPLTVSVFLRREIPPQREQHTSLDAGNCSMLVLDNGFAIEYLRGMGNL